MDEPEVLLKTKSDVFIYEEAGSAGTVYRVWPSPIHVSDENYTLQFRNFASVEVTLDVSKFGKNQSTLVLGPKNQTTHPKPKGQVTIADDAVGVYEYNGKPELVGNSGPRIIVDL